MKFNKFLMGIFGAMALTACSSDEPVNNGGLTPPDGEFSDNYVSVSVEMPNASGSRTTTNDGLYDDGTKEESTVSNVVFFFFDNEDKCIDIQMVTNPKFENPAKPSLDPNITNYGRIEVRLKSGIVYTNSKIVVALNSPASDANSLKSEVRTLANLQTRNSADYIGHIADDGSMQVMSNSVYYNTDKAETKPTLDKKVWYNVITADHIYTSAQRPDIDELITKGTKKEVDIYVERVAARIDVSNATFDLTDYYTYMDNGTKKTTITLYDHVNLTQQEVTIKPEIQGMCLNVLAQKARLIKPINHNDVGYGIGDSDGYKNFRWNDPANKRSYWAATDFASTYKYFSWNNAVTQGADAFSQYINPNTQDYLPVSNNEGNSLNTKIMVVAELNAYDAEGNRLVVDPATGAIIKTTAENPGKPLDFVRYGADYMLSGSLLAHFANQINVAVRAIDWSKEGLTLNGEALTENQLKTVIAGVNNAFLGTDGKGINGSMLKLGMLNPAEDNAPGEADWEAKVSTNVISYDVNLKDEVNDLSALKETVTAKIDAVITSTLKALNDAAAILYWKDGKTYFYHNIRHQGFYGLLGAGTDDFLYGVVRNHIYKINLNGIYGLGTPVIEPGRPIDPDRPDDERPSFIRAKINILPWRVVTNNATIH